MQHEIVQAKPLLNERGELTERGYARSLVLSYDRSQIKARSYRIKEWDYYLIMNSSFGVALTIADNSYMALVSVSFLDFNQPRYKTSSVIKPFTFGRLHLPSSSSTGDCHYEDKRIQMSFLHLEDKQRRLICQMKRFDGDRDFACDLLLSEEPAESMVIATPFAEDRTAFYYNQKINCMRAAGMVTYGNQQYHFDPADATATLDWGRGVWTYRNTWYWGSASGYVDGKHFGFNIGYGFGDTRAASENMLFYEGTAHKLEEVRFHIPMKGRTYDYLRPWTFSSSDGRFEMTFSPFLDRSDATSIGIISSDQHQVFGKFDGIAILDDGTIIELKQFLGFAERVTNRW